MAEDRARLQQLLAELRTQLAESTSVDAKTRARLEATITDTERALSGQPPRRGAGEPLTERLGEAAGDFEATHPTLSGTLGSIIDALGRMGI
jgi:Domain of unknown function (DUF4404)